MKSKILLGGVLSVLASMPLHAADATVGKTLVEANCSSCHGTEVYTRPDRKIRSYPQLQTQVRRCELALGLKWFDEDIDNAASYLNQEYYKFQ